MSLVILIRTILFTLKEEIIKTQTDTDTQIDRPRYRWGPGHKHTHRHTHTPTHKHTHTHNTNFVEILQKIIFRKSYLLNCEI